MGRSLLNISEPSKASGSIPVAEVLRPALCDSLEDAALNSAINLWDRLRPDCHRSGLDSTSSKTAVGVCFPKFLETKQPRNVGGSPMPPWWIGTCIFGHAESARSPRQRFDAVARLVAVNGNLMKTRALRADPSSGCSRLVTLQARFPRSAHGRLRLILGEYSTIYSDYFSRPGTKG